MPHIAGEIRSVFGIYEHSEVGAWVYFSESSVLKSRQKLRCCYIINLDVCSEKVWRVIKCKMVKTEF